MYEIDGKLRPTRLDSVRLHAWAELDAFIFNTTCTRVTGYGSTGNLSFLSIELFGNGRAYDVLLNAGIQTPVPI